MSKTTPAPEAQQQQNVDLVLSNTVSRLGCTVAEARKILAQQAKEAANLTPAKPGQPPASKGESSDEALL